MSRCSRSEISQVTLPRALYCAEGVRALDRFAIERCGIPGLTLMERAGAAAFEVLRARWPEARRIGVLCGKGNNGGDGYVLGRLAHEAGLDVRLVSLVDVNDLRGDAKAAAQAFVAARSSPERFAGGIPDADVLVDALFGTGLDRDVGGEAKTAIDALRGSRVPVLAIDIPSGLHADTGRVMGSAVMAEATVSFIGLKQGMFTGDGPAYSGKVFFSDLSVPPEVYASVAPTATRLDLADFGPLLAPRIASCHKGHFGHVLIVGGDYGYAGAARMAAEAAGRVGAGLVSLATRSGHAATVCAGRPEVMCHGVESSSELMGLIAKATVVAIGPGLGRSPWAAALLATVLESDPPLVVDADALNLLAEDPVQRSNWILTPHPGEAARLLATSTKAIQEDRFASARSLQRYYQGVCVLKGAGTIVDHGSACPAVCSYGNPGMASGGMGDVLTGVIAGLLAQDLTLADAAKLGVCIHGFAGDQAAKVGERGLLATDLMPWIRRLANPVDPRKGDG